MSDQFDRSHSPTYGTALRLQEGVHVISAKNPGPMTFTGTQTYVVGQDSLAVIDPGPALPDHLSALEKFIANRPVSHILLTHSHVDHSPLAAQMSQKYDAPVAAFGAADAGRSLLMADLASHANLGGAEGIDHSFKPDILLQDGENISVGGFTLTALHTPGHLSNHLCFALGETGAVFSGDHIMGWATTMVSPPDGDLRMFMNSLDKMAARTGDTIYYPGHGGPVTDPHAMIAHQRSHRQGREAQILAQLGKDRGTPLTLATAIYTDVDPRLIPAAARNVFAHLIDLYERDLVRAEGPISPDTNFCLK